MQWKELPKNGVNINKSKRPNLKLKEIVLEPLAGSYSLFSEDEGEMGVVLIDIGGSLTNVAVFLTGGIRHSFVLPVGGTNLIQDIAIGLRTSMEIAEMVMVRYGTCVQEKIEPGEKFVLPDDSALRKEVEKTETRNNYHASGMVYVFVIFLQNRFPNIEGYASHGVQQ